MLNLKNVNFLRLYLRGCLSTSAVFQCSRFPHTRLHQGAASKKCLFITGTVQTLEFKNPLPLLFVSMPFSSAAVVVLILLFRDKLLNESSTFRLTSVNALSRNCLHFSGLRLLCSDKHTPFTLLNFNLCV